MANVYHPLQFELEKASGVLVDEKPLSQIDYIVAQEYFDTDPKNYQKEFKNH